jgi:hypothetical protein
MTKEEFTSSINDWSNHRILLWDALEATKHTGLPVLELGSGEGSTPYLRQYCIDNNLELLSYDYDKDWAEVMQVTHVTNWDTQLPWRKDFSVALVDMSPGEYRKIALTKLENTHVIILHDSEPIGHNASDYQVRPVFSKFKYVFDYEEKSPKAWATWLSNTIKHLCE